MCLAVPGKLVRRERDGDEAVCEMHGTSVRVSTVLLPDAGVGDWVLVHAGFAIQKLSPEEAAETFAVLDDVKRTMEAAEAGEQGVPR